MRMELGQALTSYQDYHMLSLIKLRQALISYQDYHMLSLIKLRQALISYRDYHMLLLTPRRPEKEELVTANASRRAQLVPPFLPPVSPPPSPLPRPSSSSPDPVAGCLTRSDYHHRVATVLRDLTPGRACCGRRAGERSLPQLGARFAVVPAA